MSKFKKGDKVKIIEGHHSGVEGTIAEVDAENARVRVIDDYQDSRWHGTEELRLLEPEIGVEIIEPREFSCYECRNYPICSVVEGLDNATAGLQLVVKEVPVTKRKLLIVLSNDCRFFRMEKPE